MNSVFLYVLAVAAQRAGVRVHAFCVLSNHCHLVVTDPDARLPAFVQYLDSLVARAMNAVLGRSEAFWGPPSYSGVTLLAPRDIVDKTAYVLANPVAAGLVRSGREWPGLWSAPERIGAGAFRVARPKLFFRQKGGLPEHVDFELGAPPGFASAEAFRQQLVAALAAREREASSALEAAGRTFMGASRVLAQKITAYPTAEEPRHTLIPTVAGRDKWKRIEALGQLVEFRRAYRAAWRDLRLGIRDVLFPHGTYWMRVAHGVVCAPSG